MTQRYDFSEISESKQVSPDDLDSFIDEYPNNIDLQRRVHKLTSEFARRCDAISVRTPSIDGKSTNPFVLAAFARSQRLKYLTELDEVVAAAKIFSSLETALGRVVEDIVPAVYGWDQVKSSGHSVLSEIDSARVDKTTDTVYLAALKSGPSCINDSMVSQIANAISSYWTDWAGHWSVNNVHYLVGMNYSTGKNSNKKDWHIVRLTEEKILSNGGNIVSSCIKTKTLKGKDKLIAKHSFSCNEDGRRLTVEVRQGREFWNIIGVGNQNAYLEICLALAKSISQRDSAPHQENYIIDGIDEVIGMSKSIDTAKLGKATSEWFSLFVRHFVDGFGFDTERSTHFDGIREEMLTLIK